MTTQYGTSHFVSRARAEQYYKAQGEDNWIAAVDRKLKAGEIHIGRPKLKAGEQLSIDETEGRYFIQTADEGKWPPPGGISDKLYRCGTCAAEFKTSTNHWGDIYTCPRCHSTSRSVCIETPPLGYARPTVATVHTRIHYYRYDISKPEQAQAYAALREQLSRTQGKCFNTYGNPKEKSADKTGDHYEPIELEIEHLFDDQWNSTTARVFDWYEAIYPNERLKSGHWLEITDEMRALRHNTHACGYCGHQQPVSDAVFHTGCLDSAYLKVEDLHLLRLRRIDDRTDREPLTDQEKAKLLPLYVECQTSASDSRAVSRREKQRANILKKYDSSMALAKEEYDGMSWLLDHRIDLEMAIYYSHTRKFGIGWRSPLAPEVKAALMEKLAGFPFPYEFG